MGAHNRDAACGADSIGRRNADGRRSGRNHANAARRIHGHDRLVGACEGHKAVHKALVARADMGGDLCFVTHGQLIFALLQRNGRDGIADVYQTASRNAIVRGDGHSRVSGLQCGNAAAAHRQHGGVGAFPGEESRRTCGLYVADVQPRVLLADDPQLRFGEFKGFHRRINRYIHLIGSPVAGCGDGGFANGMRREHAVLHGDDGRIGALPDDFSLFRLRKQSGGYGSIFSHFNPHILR